MAGTTKAVKALAAGLDVDSGIEAEIAADEAAELAQRGRVGRPRLKINWEMVQFMASIGASQKEICAVLGVAPSTMRRGRRGKIFGAMVARGQLKANVSIRRVLYSVLRGAITDPVTKTVVVVPLEEQIAMAKFLANRRQFMRMEEACVKELEGDASGDGENVLVVRVGAPEQAPGAPDEGDDDDFEDEGLPEVD